MNQLKRFLLNGTVAVAVTLLIRTVGVLLNVYISGKIGTAAMGLLTLVMSVYGFAVTFATSGINLAVTRMVAEALGTGDSARARRAMRVCLLYAVLFGAAASILLFLFAEPLGTGLLGDARTVSSLRFLSVSLTPIALSSALSGYFTAVRRVTKSAVSVLFEQGLRIGLTVGGLLVLAPRGMEYACLSVVGGASLSEFFGFLLSLALYLHDRRKHLPAGKGNGDGGVARYMLSITLPVALSSYVRSALVTLEHILIPRGLKRQGADTDRALSAYGMLHGMALPLVLFPGAIPGAFAGLIIPEVAERKSRDDPQGIRRVAERVFRVTLTFSVGVSALLFTFSQELGLCVYGSAETGLYIRYLAPLIPVMYLDNAVDALLKGLGEQFASMRINILDAALCVVLVWLLVPVAELGGYIITIFLSEVLNLVLSVRRLTKILVFRAEPVIWLLLPLLFSGAACFTAHTLALFLPGDTILRCTAGMVAAVLLYTGQLFLSGLLKRPARARKSA